MLAEPSASTVEPTLTPSAPTTAPADTRTPSTSDAAVKAGDAKAYREARHRERLDRIEGKTTAPVETPAATPDTPVQPAPKKKSLEGRRVSVDAEVEDLKRQLAVRDELRRQLKATDAPAKPAETPKPDTKAKPSWADDPAAPKLENFENYEAYVDARAEFIAEKRLEARLSERDSRSQAERTAYTRAEGVTKQAQTFKDRVETWQKANASAELSPQLLGIMPQSAIEAHNAFVGPDQQIPLGAEHFIVEHVFRSEHPGELLSHFSQHPDVFERLYTLAHQDPASVVRQIGALEAQVSRPASPAPSPSARVSSLPNPPTVLTGKTAVLDPVRSAVSNGDARAYRAARHQERLARIAR